MIWKGLIGQTIKKGTDTTQAIDSLAMLYSYCITKLL